MAKDRTKFMQARLKHNELHIKFLAHTSSPTSQSSVTIFSTANDGANSCNKCAFYYEHGARSHLRTGSKVHCETDMWMKMMLFDMKQRRCSSFYDYIKAAIITYL